MLFIFQYSTEVALSLLHRGWSWDRVNRLKKHKAPGIDALGSPVYKSFTEPLINHLTGLFNQVLRSGAYPNAWAVGVIKPIYKNGIRSDPSNY